MNKGYLLIYLLISFFGLSAIVSFGNGLGDCRVISDTSTPQTAELELPDKVYTFTSPTDTVTFESLYLEKEYTYLIWIELVTPHNVSKMRIKIWDPDNREFKIFVSEMFYEPEAGRYFEVPFGTAMSGNYEIEFYVETDDNCNIYIRIEKALNCLYDKIGDDANNIEFYRVKTFNDGMRATHDLDLETDISYKFYIGRVSAISENQDNEIRMNYYITNPEGVTFTIYNDDELADIDGISSFFFGTATGGEFTLTIDIFPTEVQYANIAYLVVKDHEISDVVEVNDTGNPSKDKDDEDMFDNFFDNSTAIPPEALLSASIIVGTMVIAMVVIIKRHDRKSKAELDLRK